MVRHCFTLFILCPMGPPQSTKNENFLRRIVMYIFPVFFSSSMTVNFISLGSGQTKTFEDVILDFGKH